MLFHHVLVSWQVHPASHKVSSEKWQEVWESKSAMYCGSSRVRGKRPPPVQEERVATFNWMVDLNHALTSCGKRLRDFAEQDEILAAPLLKKPRTLWLCSDQEAVQIAAANFLKHSGIWLVHIYDPCHRSNNDLILSLSHAGLLRQTMWAMASYNILSGPWGRGNHWAMIQEMAARLSDLCDPDNELLLKFYPSILADEGRNPEENTCQNRAQYLAELPASQAARKGLEASLSRFNSIWKAHEQLDGSWSSRAFLFLACCLLHGLVSRDSLAEFSTDVHGFSGPENKEAAKKQVRMALATGAKSALLQVTKFCLSDDNKAIARLTYFVMKPEADASGRFMQDLRGPDKTLAWYAQQAHWGWMETAREHWATLTDLHALSRIGFDLSLISQADADRVAWEDGLAKTIFVLILKVLRFRGGSKLWHCA